jgi:hypothetical protein
MKKILFLVLPLLVSFTVKAQGIITWTRVDTIAVSDDIIMDAIQLPDSGYVLAGNTKVPSGPYTDNLLLRTNKNGDTLWTRRWGTTAYDGLFTIAQRPGGGYVAAGDGNSRSFIFLDSMGNIESTHNFGGVFTLMDVAVLPDSGFIFTGIYGSYPYGSDVMMLRADKNGDSLWTRRFGTVRADLGRSVIYTSDGNYVVAGQANFEYYADGTYVPQRAYILKIDPAGSLIWSDTIPGSVVWRSDAMDVLENKLGEYLITGSADGSNGMIANYSSSGTRNWLHQYVNPYTSIGYTSYQFYSIAQKCDGGYITVGYQTRPAAPATYGGLIVSVNSTGDTLFTSTSSPSFSGTILRKIIPTLDSGYFAAGYTIGSGSYSQNPFLRKIDAQAGVNGLGVIGSAFTYSAAGFSVSFSDLSYGATSWYWDFGDGNSATTQSPVNVYAVPGTYSVCLTAWNYCDTAYFCDSLTVSATTSIDEENALQVSIFPNPSDGAIHIRFNSAGNDKVLCKLTDIAGKELYSSAIRPVIKGLNLLDLDISTLSKGMYLLEMEIDRKLVRKKVVRN